MQHNLKLPPFYVTVHILPHLLWVHKLDTLNDTP